MTRSFWKTMMLFTLTFALLGTCSCGNAKAPIAALQSVKWPDPKIPLTDAEWDAAELLKSPMNKFAAKTTEALFDREKGNVLYSPLSLYYALSMAACGADGETASELLALLGAEDIDSLAESCRALLHVLSQRRYRDEDESTKLTLTNSIWSQLALKDAYVDQMAEKLCASCFPVEQFDQKTSDAISSWISEQTDGKLSPKLTFPEATLAVLLNTVAFKSEWIDKFESGQNTEDVFHAVGGDQTVTYMNATKHASFLRGDDYLTASLSLKGGAMTFILPDEGISPRDLLASHGFDELLNGGKSGYGEVIYQIPKFSVDSDLDLVEMVKACGASSLFGGNADFTRMTDQMVLVSAIRQGSHIEVNEKGVDASAYTAIYLCGSAMETKLDHAELILDRPFLYTLKSSDGTILFVGLVESIS